MPGSPASFLSSGVLVLLGAAFAVACGPSVQAIHEGDVRFEHCYRLDLDLDIAPTHREVCWKRWLTSYTYGQPRDRLEYARRRVRAFASGDVTRPSLELSSAAPPAQRQSLGIVPAPTSLHAPPPPIAAVAPPDAGAPAPPVAADAGTDEPSAACSTVCKEDWQSCATACGPDAGASAGCRRCERDYKACMRRCFK